eukprot:XP_011680656.1 PREDICTED: WSC domain-containing protein 2-like [Strongylocentrotus purpuratus]
MVNEVNSQPSSEMTSHTKDDVTSSAVTTTFSTATTLQQSGYGSYVRLVGGPTSNKGTVEIRIGNGTWETTCGVNLSINDVIVICRQLGFTGANRAITGTPYQQDSTPTRGLECNGGDGYIGCVEDDARDRVLPGVRITSSSISISYCIQYCSESTTANYVYAGVEAGNECFCGEDSDNYTRHGVGSDDDCQIPCSGDPTESCGGLGYIAIFTSDGYIGCVEDDARDRVLPGVRITSSSISISYCIQYCSESTTANYVYAGVEAGNECFCGEDSDNYTRHGVGSDDDCQIPCSGDPTESCGGLGYIAIFTSHDYPSTPSTFDMNLLGQVEYEPSPTLLTLLERGEGVVTADDSQDHCITGHL